MNREIKFRAKAINNNFFKGEWVDGYYTKVLWSGKLIDVITDGAHEIPIQIDTLGQFTGLLDKNGKEIYEHDYISIVYKYDDIGANCGVIPDQDCICEGEVVYMDQYSCFGLRLYKAEYPIKGSMEECPYLTISLFHFDLECDSIEVLNNIYDHPELIKEE